MLANTPAFNRLATIATTEYPAAVMVLGTSAERGVKVADTYPDETLVGALSIDFYNMVSSPTVRVSNLVAEVRSGDRPSGTHPPGRLEIAVLRVTRGKIPRPWRWGDGRPGVLGCCAAGFGVARVDPW